MKNLGFLLLYLTSLALLVSSKDICSLISESTFNEMLKHRADEKRECSGGFYTYVSFIEAARSFPDFATTGGTNTRKREIAAFFAHTSEQTAAWWDETLGDKHEWGYCNTHESGHHPPPYCYPNPQWPCAEGKYYYGRGPFLITGNDDYGQAGKAIGFDLLGNPELVESDPTISFKTALWRWMTPLSATKPSSHDVITKKWKPSAIDKAAGRVPGFGLTTNILTYGHECSKDSALSRRVGFYKRYCSLLGVSPGASLDCIKQKPFP